MAVKIVVPQLGNEISEAEITEWLKAPGEAVSKGDPLVMITTTKMAMELEAEADGIMGDIAQEEGDIVEVGAVLGVINPA